MSNQTLSNAQYSPDNDEYYTRRKDIDEELKYYEKHFINKVVYCNCDDPRMSNFYKYFKFNFKRLKLKRLITTCYLNASYDLLSEHNWQHGKQIIYDGIRERERESLGVTEAMIVKNLLEI